MSLIFDNTSNGSTYTLFVLILIIILSKNNHSLIIVISYKPKSIYCVDGNKHIIVILICNVPFILGMFDLLEKVHYA